MSLRIVVVLVAASLAVGGCSSGGDDRRRGTPATAPAAPAAPVAARILEFPACEGSSVPDRGWFRAGWRRASTRVGPVLIVEANRLANADLAGRSVWKIRALHPPSRSLSIEIGARASSHVGFVKDPRNTWSGSPADLYPALRVQDCPRLPPEIGPLYAGERYALPLFVGVRRDSCVPITVTRNDGRPHRRVISFGAGDCA